MSKMVKAIQRGVLENGAKLPGPEGKILSRTKILDVQPSKKNPTVVENFN